MAEKIVATDEQWAELLAAHPAPGEWCAWRCSLGKVIICNPTEPEHFAFANETWGKEGATGYPAAYRNALIMQCVFPAKDTLVAWLKRWPGLPTSAGVMRAIKHRVRPRRSREKEPGC